MVNINIQEKEKAYRIPEGIYGLNMEITRTTFWQGLMAQMLCNRKFYAGDDNGPFGWVLEEADYIREQNSSPCQSSYIKLNANSSISYTAESVLVKKDHLYEIRALINSCNADRKFSIEAAGKTWQTDVKASKEEFSYINLVIKADEDIKNGTFKLTLTEGSKSYVYAVSYMDKDNYYGMRPDVIEMLAKLKPSYLRFPGGCCADHFEWKEGLKPVDFRKPMDGAVKNFLFRDSFHQDTNDIGINEFVLLCRKVGAEPEYTSRLVLSEPQEAGDLVEYCNGGDDTYWGSIRESLGFTPFNIKLWYVGNEIYFFGYGLEHDAVKAARVTDEYIRAMKKSDPTIKTIIGVCPHSEIHKEWSIKYVENIKSEYDFVSYHRYNGTEIDSEKSDLLYADNVRKMLIDGYDHGLENMQNIIFKDKYDKIQIIIDEWNYSWGLKGSNLMTLSNALMLNFMIKYFNKWRISDARFFHPINEGMLDVSPETVKMDTSGTLFEYFQKHRNGILLSAISDNKDVDCVATKHQNNTVISIINRVDKQTEINIIDNCLGKEITEYRISGILMNNITAFENTIELVDSVISKDGVISISANSILFIEY